MVVKRALWSGLRFVMSEIVSIGVHDVETRAHVKSTYVGVDFNIVGPTIVENILQLRPHTLPSVLEQ